MKECRHRWGGRAQQPDEEISDIEVALVRRAKDGREDLLSLCTVPGTVPTSTHLARDDSGSERVFGAPVGGVERGVEEEAEDRVVIDIEMIGEATDTADTTRAAGDEATQPLQIVAAGHGEASVREVALGVAIARGECRLQHGFHLRRKRMGRIVQHEDATPAQQMRETRLMPGVGELPVRLPAVMLQDAGELGANDAGGLSETAAGIDAVHRRVGGDERPQPLHVGLDAPAGFIDRHNRAAADGGAQGLISRVGLARRAVPRRAPGRPASPSSESGFAGAVHCDRRRGRIAY